MPINCQATLFGFVLAIATTLPTASADTISLRSAVRLPPAAEIITLADVAEIEGEHAGLFKAIEIGKPMDGQAMEVSVQDVRRCLDAAGVNWSKVNLSGRRVIVRSSRHGQAAPQAMVAVALSGAQTDASAAPAEPVAQTADSLLEEPTLRGMIAGLMTSQLQIDPQRLRLTFQAQDGEWLDTPMASARMELQPLGDVAADRVDFAVRTWSDGKVAGSRTIRFNPEVRAPSAVLRRDIHNDQTIAADDVEIREQWFPAGQAYLIADPASCIGRIACRTLKSGQTLRSSQVRRDALVKKGDQVTVRCLVGGVAISLKAQAHGDGAVGEMIEFRKIGERQSFTAMVSGRGEAVLDLARSTHG